MALDSAGVPVLSIALHRGALVSITDVSCRGQDTRCGAEECTHAHQVIVTRSGAFVKHTGGKRVVAAPPQVLLLNAFEPYRVSHPVSGGDQCTALAFPVEVLREALAAYQPALGEWEGMPFRFSHGPLSPRALFRLQQLRSRLRGGAASSLETEEVALAILREVIGDSCRMRGVLPGKSAGGSSRNRRELAEATKERLLRRPGAGQSLASLARQATCSPFHLARTFKREVGMPIHQYLLRLRLSLALERLSEGEPNLSALAHSLGWSSHSHFTIAFRRVFSMSPSLFRARVTRSLLSRTRRHLEVA